MGETFRGKDRLELFSQCSQRKAKRLIGAELLGARLSLKQGDLHVIHASGTTSAQDMGMNIGEATHRVVRDAVAHTSEALPTRHVFWVPNILLSFKSEA